MRRAALLCCAVAVFAACPLDPLVHGGAPVDAGAPDADHVDDAGVSRDAGLGDAGVDDAGASDGGAVDAGVTDAGVDVCATPVPDYVCVVGQPDTCPGGQCWFGSCVGPALDDHRFDGCGDGTCAGCESGDEAHCPADCDVVTPPHRASEDDASLTVFVHGIALLPTPTISAKIYGAAVDGEDLGAQLASYDVAFGAAHDIVGVEYYGTNPDPSFSDAEAAWVDEIPFNTPEALERYARVVALFIEHRAPHDVRLLCHSMGCYVSRYLIENDVGGLASSGVVTRLVTVSGAVQGARMANMVDNPVVQQYAGTGAFNIWDISALDPDHARDVVASYDHKLERADNPMFAGMRLHSVGGSDPTLDEAGNFFSLGAIHNPDLLPEDGVVFTLESFFADEDDANRARTVDGVGVLPTHAFLHKSHNAITRDPGAGLMAWSGLYAHTEVELTLSSLSLVVDHEHHDAFDGQLGDAPAEIAAETTVSVVLATGEEVLVDERKLEQFTPDLVILDAGDTVAPNLSLFSGPIPDDATAVHVAISLVEVDHYTRFHIDESTFFAKSDPLAAADVVIPIADSSDVPVDGDDAQAVLTLRRDRF